MKIYSEEFWVAFDAHMLWLCDDSPADPNEHIRTALAGCYNTAGFVETDPLFAGQRLFESGSVLFWADDIRALFMEFGLADSLITCRDQRVSDVYALMVGRWLSRNGYRQAALARNAAIRGAA